MDNDTPENKFDDIVIRPVREPEAFIMPKVEIHPLIPNPYDGELLLIMGRCMGG